MSIAEHSGSGGNSAWNRRFCNQCYNLFLVDPSIGSISVCPICKADQTEESYHQSLSSANSSLPLNANIAPFVFDPPSTRFIICRNATFEQRIPSENSMRIISDFGFFNSWYRNWESATTPTLHTGTVLSWVYLRKYLVDCVNEGAKINSSLHQHQLLQIFENFDNLNHLEHTPEFIIASLPNVNITRDNIALEEIECPICTENFKIGEEAKNLPCEHLYHKDCIEHWLKTHKSCPLCRCELNIPEPSYDKLRAAWIPQPLILSGTIEQNTIQTSSNSRARRFQIELLWPLENLLSPFRFPD